jgi:hypothetical protein
MKSGVQFRCVKIMIPETVWLLSLELRFSELYELTRVAALKCSPLATALESVLNGLVLSSFFPFFSCLALLLSFLVAMVGSPFPGRPAGVI